ncbi:hypothetical protein [Parapedobacter koreensis]|uniref:Uncharacterized protein n=1 Tax=Parapedobacter koreensis TaxID=332977 RepID=A0A1H7JY66_9SPHI|nr:hypothetical protein [Parapedobacter koreensis]SEK79334.1 hypothetical protein SAMN05421740_102710 [Parapedobacter koreensis]
MKRFFFLMVGLFFFGVRAWCQSDNRSEITALQDSLVKLGYIMYNEPSEPDRLDANFTFVKTLVAALKVPHSYSFPFDSLNMVSILAAPDGKFRIFSWHIQLNDGSYLYYGTIQLNTPDGSLKLYPLLDKTYEIQDPERAVTATDNWYGAQYYRMIPLDGDYILLGWKGYNPGMTQKVIDVLQLTGSGARLGKAVFNGADTQQNTRMIYRYSRQASMYMDYDSAANHIILDHLAPADTPYEGQYEHYGPDMSYDAWQLGGGRLRLISDVPLMNPPSPSDDGYNDPKNLKNHPKSGFSGQQP